MSGRVKYPEIDEEVSYKMGSNMEIIEVPRREMVVEDKIFVAVGKEVKESKSTLRWALQNSRGKQICIAYVHQPAQWIPMPMGGRFPADQVGEKELVAFRENESQEMIKILDEYLQICAKVGVRAEKVYLEADIIEGGIVKLISQHRMGRLVMGAAADNRYSRKMMEIKSRKANYVRQHAPDFCHIWFVCKGHLIYTRESPMKSSPDRELRPSYSSDSIQSETGALSKHLASGLGLSDVGQHEGRRSEFDQSSRASYSQSSDQSLQAEYNFSSPSSSFGREDVKEASLALVALPLPLSQSKHHDSSPPSVLESSRTDDLYDQLEQAMTEAENARREAFEESMRRRKAEKEAIEAFRKAKAAERLYYEELKHRKEIQNELSKGMEEFENIKHMRDKVSEELNEAIELKKSLESQIERSNLAMKELEEKILSAVRLLQKYKEERDALQMQRDHALEEAAQLRKELAEEPSSSHVPVYFSEFPFSDLDRATNHFDPSLKIGEGGYGSIYKGFIRHTRVAIKILHPNSMQGPQEFQQEVDVLSKLRHPNLVTLIGACPESWTLVYEYLGGGSLEDRLNCKDNAPPLPWQTRIRIASELCSVLIFLHSSRPSSIVHGDLKPSNVLLDDNLVCKLSDFGICRVISSSETSMGYTGRFFTEEPKGTFQYMDPEFLATGELTTKSDVYSFGVILLRLLTGKQALGISKEVQYVLDKGNLNDLLDPSAGDWPFVQAEQLARVALRCCDMNRCNRPDLATEVWRVLEPMKASCGSLSSLGLADEDGAPFYFICPIFQEIMQDPHIAADGYTYEAEAIRGWLDSGHENSPMTNQKLENAELIPNRALKSAIQEWLQQQTST